MLLKMCEAGLLLISTKLHNIKSRGSNACTYQTYALYGYSNKANIFQNHHDLNICSTGQSVWPLFRKQGTFGKCLEPTMHIIHRLHV